MPGIRSLTFSCVTAVLTTTVCVSASAQSPRKAVEARYEQLADAIRRKDVDAILAFKSKNFSSDNVNSVKFDYAAMEQYTRRMTTAIDSVIHVRNIIRSFEQHGDTAIANVCQEFSRIQLVADAPRRVDTSVLQRELWVQEDSVWKLVHVDDEHGMRWFVDGKRVDPTRPNIAGPAYSPVDDPPTGCGLR